MATFVIKPKQWQHLLKTKKITTFVWKKNDLGAKTETARAIINQAWIDDIFFFLKQWQHSFYKTKTTTTIVKKKLDTRPKTGTACTSAHCGLVLPVWMLLRRDGRVLSHSAGVRGLADRRADSVDWRLPTNRRRRGSSRSSKSSVKKVQYINFCSQANNNLLDM